MQKGNIYYHCVRGRGTRFPHVHVIVADIVPIVLEQKARLATCCSSLTSRLSAMAEATYPSAANGGEEQPRSQAINQRLGEFRKFVSTNFTRTKQVMNNCRARAAAKR